MPQFDGLSTRAAPLRSQSTRPQTGSAQSSPGPVRVPPLTPDKLAEYTSLFEKSGAENGLLSGSVAKQIFERARLPNEVLGRIWTLADTQSRGMLEATEFAVAMHLLASYKSGTMKGVPQSLPAGLWEAAARRGGVSRSSTGSFPGPPVPPAATIPSQITGTSTGQPQSPLDKHPFGTSLSAQPTGGEWAVTPADKAKFDQIFAGVDQSNRGFITGDQAVEFFANARLPDETLAQIWDLADINSEGRLNKDEFAVAMYLIRQQRATKDRGGNLPTALPPALIPPAMRKQHFPSSRAAAPHFQDAPVTRSPTAADDLFGLDASPTPALPQIAQSTGGSLSADQAQRSKSPFVPPASAPSPNPSTTFKPFVPSSSFGQSLAPQATGGSSGGASRSLPNASSDDLLGDADPQVSQKLTGETSELANLTNQVNSLTKHAQDVQSTKQATSQELSQGSQQKQEYEARLSQLRTLYEKETGDVKALQGQLTSQRSELKRLQQDLAVLDGGLQDLRNQRLQLMTTLDAEEKERTAVQAKIKSANSEIDELKPQIERLTSEARRQKGLASISKKQLTTLEEERERLQGELNDAQADLDEGIKRAENDASADTQTSATQSPKNLASPSASHMSATNPFLRRGTGQSDLAPATSPSPANDDQQKNARQQAFDSVFGPSFSSPMAASPTHALPQAAERNGEGNSRPASDASREHAFHAEPSSRLKSEQGADTALPFSNRPGQPDRTNSSENTPPDGSSLSSEDEARASTPAVEKSTGPDPMSQPSESPAGRNEMAPGDGRRVSSRSSSFQEAPSYPLTANQPSQNGSEADGSSQEIPGAFPQILTPRPDMLSTGMAMGVAAGAAALAAGGAVAGAAGFHQASDEEEKPEQKQTHADSSFDKDFDGSARSHAASNPAADFDRAFASMQSSTTNDASGTRSEFPPIKELDDDDESEDSNEVPQGFEDNFTESSPQAGPEVARGASGPSLAPTQSTHEKSTADLPGIDAQNAPPTYGQSVSSDGKAEHFPPKFEGLLPHRGDPTSDAAPPHSFQHGSVRPVDASLSQPYAPEASQMSTSAQAGGLTGQSKEFTEHDFDSAFAGMAPAPVLDDDSTDDDNHESAFNRGQTAGTTFDPTFDSTPDTSTAPQFSPTTKDTPPAGGSSRDIASDLANTGHISRSNGGLSTTKLANTPGSAAGGFKDSEWDAMFNSFDRVGTDPFGAAHGNANASTATSDPSAASASSVFPHDDSIAAIIATTNTELKNENNQNHNPVDRDKHPPRTTTATTTESSGDAAGHQQQDRPPLSHSVSTDSQHDDPILKRLTSIGWSREDSLKALERFDYNLDKVCR